MKQLHKQQTMGDDSTGCSTRSGSAANKQCHQCTSGNKAQQYSTPARAASRQPAVQPPLMKSGDKPQYHRMATLMTASRIQPPISQRIHSTMGTLPSSKKLTIQPLESRQPYTQAPQPVSHKHADKSQQRRSHKLNAQTAL